jgi:hypothetical protein
VVVNSDNEDHKLLRPATSKNVVSVAKKDSVIAPVTKESINSKAPIEVTTPSKLKIHVG